MTNQICPCTYTQSQNATNFLSLVYPVLQIALFSYPIINIPIYPHDPQKKNKYIIKIMLGFFCGLALTIFTFSLINIIRGAEENIKLRQYYCDGVSIQRKSDNDCKYIYGQQNAINFINLFNSSACTILCILLMFYFSNNKKIILGSACCILLSISTFIVTYNK